MDGTFPILHVPKPKGEKVLLINPPSPFLIEERVFTPTGILYAASELEHAGFAVDVLDLARPSRSDDADAHYNDLVREYEQSYLGVVRDAVSEYQFIGVSSTTPQFKFASKILETVRDVNPDAIVSLGGAHATVISGLRRRMIDHLCAEDSSLKQDPVRLESKLHEFDPNFRSVAAFDMVVSGGAIGMIDVLNGRPKWVTSPKLGRNIDAVPWPARHKIDLESYQYFLRNPRTGERVATTNVMSQWGCPFPCNFCSGRDEDFYRTVRTSSPAATIAELDAIHDRYGIKGFMFFDDEINVVPKRFEELLGLLKQRHLERGYVYRGFVKSEIITERHTDMFDRMIDAGFAEACTGVESGSDRILTEVIRKNTTYGINLRSAELARQAGISFKAFTMLGHPSESESDVMMTHRWLLEARPTGFDVTVHQPYPGAPVYDFAVRDPKTGVFFLTPAEVDLAAQRKFTHNSRIEDAIFYFQKPDYGASNIDSFYKGRPGEYTSNVWTPALSPGDIVRLRDFIEADVRGKIGAGSVSGLSYDAVMGQSAPDRKRS